MRDEVEGDVDAPGPRSHSIGMLIDRHLVERIDLRRLSHASRGADLLGNLVELCLGATGEEDLGSLSGEGTGDRATD
jgi:hypothetical protein